MIGIHIKSGAVLRVAADRDYGAKVSLTVRDEKGHKATVEFDAGLAAAFAADASRAAVAADAIAVARGGS